MQRIMLICKNQNKILDLIILKLITTEKKFLILGGMIQEIYKAWTTLKRL